MQGIHWGENYIKSMLVLIALVVGMILIGIGIAIGLVGCAIAAALLGVGVISSSVFVGLWSGRTRTGLRVFLLQCGLLAGIPAGAVCAWLGQSFLSAYGSGWPALVYGAIGGAFAGVVIALLLDLISRRLHSWAAQRLVPLRSRATHSLNRPA